VKQVISYIDAEHCGTTGLVAHVLFLLLLEATISDRRTGRTIPLALRPVRRRLLIDHLRGTWRVSIRGACRVLESDPKMYRYKSRRGDQAALKERIKGIAETRVRYGYRRIHVLLRREGWAHQ
jgi:hypothetical protein